MKFLLSRAVSGLTAIFLALLLPAVSLMAQDTVMRVEGNPVTGKILGSDPNGVRIEVVVIPGQPPATMMIRPAQIKEITFGDTPAMLELLRTATATKLPQLAMLWQQREEMLALKGSLAANIGLVYAQYLLTSTTAGAKASSLKIYEKIVANTTDEFLRSKAAEGRLQALISVGRADEAVEDAKKLAENSDDPTTLIQAKFILAEASFKQLQKLIEDNPKWEEDVNIRPKRNQLYHDTLDLYLYPAMFYGAETEPAARGIWGAVQVCKLGENLPEARELARDLEILYPSTSFAILARAFVATLTPELQKQNYEKQKE